MAYDNDNIFAKILRGELPCHKIHEDSDTLAFLDIMPQSKGHTLVLPKAPFENIFDIDEASLCRLMSTVRRLAPVIRDAMGADGIRLMQFNGKAAGQTVFHIHVHIIPRYKGVALKHHGAQPQQAEILEKNAAIIRAALEKAAV